MEKDPLPTREVFDALVGPWALLTPTSQISGLSEGTENRGWLRIAFKELQPDLKGSCCFPPKTLPQEVHLSTAISCSTAKPPSDGD